MEDSNECATSDTVPFSDYLENKAFCDANWRTKTREDSKFEWIELPSGNLAATYADGE